MKYLIYLLITFALLSTSVYSSPQKVSCPSHVKKLGDSDFCTVLRVSRKYTFDDSFSSPSSYAIKLTNFKASFIEYGDFNQSESDPKFSPTEIMQDSDGVIPLGTKYKTLKSHPQYSIKKRPKMNGRNYNNIVIKYNYKYKKYHGGSVYGEELNHTNVTHYAVSWCGDGVLDREYGETCEPGLPDNNGNKVQCSTRCKVMK